MHSYALVIVEDCSFVMPSLKSFAIRKALEVAVCNQTSNFIGFSFHLSYLLTFSVRFWAYLHSNPLPTGVNRFAFGTKNFGFTA